MQIDHSSGGSEATFGGAAGSILLSYYTYGTGGNNNNVHTLSNMQINYSSGGTSTTGGGAGGVSISYDGTSDNNTEIISNSSIFGCKGGDSTQGAGALSIQSVGATSHYSVFIQDSVFTSNQAITLKPDRSPLSGVAGAVRIYAKMGTNDTAHALITNTHFRSNLLGTSCIGALCMAGALAVSIPTVIDGCTFDSNSCPRCSGGIYADDALQLESCKLTNNTATQVFYGSSILVSYCVVE